MIHVTLQEAMQIGRTTDASRMQLWEACTGPFAYHADAGWDAQAFANAILYTDSRGARIPRAVKFRGDDRKAVLNALETRPPVQNSIFSMYLW